MVKKEKKQKPEIKNWYKDRYQYVVLQRKILIVITLASLACVLALLLVIAQLIPLKTIEPYVIQVDQKTGITQTVDPLEMQALTTNEAVNNYFIVQYIRARETYSTTDLLRNFDIVRVMSEPTKVYNIFQDEANPNNPQSAVARLGRAGLRQIKFKSISYLSPQVVQVRVLIEEKNDGILLSGQYHKVILLSFEYSKLSLSTEERYINPLGFRVTDYRVDEDLLQQ